VRRKPDLLIAQSQKQKEKLAHALAASVHHVEAFCAGIWIINHPLCKQSKNWLFHLTTTCFMETVDKRSAAQLVFTCGFLAWDTVY